MKRLVCVHCGHDIYSHTWDETAKRYRCADGTINRHGAKLVEASGENQLTANNGTCSSRRVAVASDVPVHDPVSPHST